MSNLFLWLTAALPLISLPTKPEPGKLAARYGIAQGINVGSVFTTKALIARTRPDGSDRDSFYSGHTSSAFTATGTLCANKPDAWCAVSFIFATTVAVARVAENRHYPSDVFVGALLGFGTGFMVWEF